MRLLLAQGSQPPSPGMGLLLPVPELVAPAVHLVAGAAWTRHLRYLILPLRLQPSPCPPAPLSAYEFCRPDITQARQSWAEQPPPHTPSSGGCHKGTNCSVTPGRCTAPAPPARCGPAPCAFLPPLGTEHQGLHPNSTSLHPPRQYVGLTASSEAPRYLAPLGSGSRPCPSLPASGNHRHARKRHRHPRPSLGFQGRQGGSGDSAAPAPLQLPPTKPSLGE